MERIKTVVFGIIIASICILGCDASANAQPQTSSSAPAQSELPKVPFELCSKIFNIGTNELFYLALASVNANRFKIDEIQSHSGYILFTVANRSFLAQVVSCDKNYSMLRVTPTDSNYYFNKGIVTNLFKYVELNLNTKIEKF